MKSLNMALMKLIRFLIIFIGFGALPYEIQAVELNSTVMFFNQDDLDKCEVQIDKAKSLNNTRVNLVTSIYVELDGRKVTSYYLKDKQAHAKPASITNVTNYQNSLIGCIKSALSKFEEVYVTTLVNQIREDRVWRNFYDYDPLKKYLSYSLYDITFSPFKRLRSLASKDQKRIYLSLTGEMGKSIKLYPQSYSQILKLLPKKLNIGISVNFNQSFGGFFNFNLKLAVLNEFDFIGFSAYPSIASKCNSQDFTDNFLTFKKRIKKYGLTKPNKQWRIHITETGIGGGMPFAGLISKLPFKGEYGAYSKRKDPWKNKKYATIRKNFYQCLLGALKQTQIIQAAFIWNADSLDVQGLYPFSQKYKNDEITQMIKVHNLNHHIQ